MDENKNLYFYRVIESPVPDGYTASAWDETGSNQSKTFTITNTLKPPYSKSAIKTVKIGSNGAVLNPEKIDTITPEDLDSWETATIDINGTQTECYLFQWMLSTAVIDVYDFHDILPENAVFVNLRNADNGGDSGSQFIMQIPHSEKAWLAQLSQVSAKSCTSESCPYHNKNCTNII